MNDQDESKRAAIGRLEQLLGHDSELRGPAGEHKPEISETVLSQWQAITDLTASICQAPAALVMKVHPSEIEVFVSANVEGNPYERGEKAQLNTGLYCEEVMAKKDKLLVPDALKDPKWDHNPDIELGMISYLGYPILWPDGLVFGTLCVLDKKENPYSVDIEALLLRFRENIETSLELMCENEQRKRAEEALRAAYDELELTVQRRTSELGKANEKLRENEARYRGLFESMSNGVAIYKAVDDGEDFIFVDFNSAGEKIEKTSRDGLVGKSVLKMFPEVKEFGLFDVFQRVWRTGEPEQHPIALYKDDGIEGWRDNFVYKLPSGEIVAIYSDETERKRAEKSLRDSEEMLKNILSATPVGTTYFEEGKLKWTNQAMVEMFGYEHEEEYLGKKSAAFYASSEEYHRVKEMFFKELAAGRSVETVTKFTRKDGSVFDGRIKISAIDPANPGKGTISSISDITERKKAGEVRLRLATAIEQAAETIVITDPEGTIRYVNPAFESVTGYTRREAVGQNPRILKSGEHDEAFYREMWETITSGGVWHGRFINKKKDGTLYEEDATISPVKDESGKIINYVAVKRDVTGEVLLEKQLRQAQKMEAIGTLSGGIAHDFNNLLTIILGYSELALLEKSEGEPGYEELQTILKTTKRGADLVRQILTFSREVETKPRPISLNHEVRHAEKLLYKTIPKMIEIELFLAEDLKTINADPVQVEQVVMNLAVNAKDAMPDGGNLVFETKNVTLDEEYCKTHLEAKPGEYVLLTVSDTGHGIEKEALDLIFEPFYTTKKPGEGTGLGLSMVHGIVKQDHGFIMCYSEPGEGTTFKIYLPVIDLDMEPDTASTEEMPAFGTETILLVDDEESIRDLGERSLSRAGYTVLTAENGQKALEVYRKQQADISLVILDLIMPEMGGRECLEELLKINPQVKALIASGFAIEGETKAFLNAEAKGTVSKPFNTRELLRSIRNVLDGV